MWKSEQKIKPNKPIWCHHTKLNTLQHLRHTNIHTYTYEYGCVCGKHIKLSFENIYRNGGTLFINFLFEPFALAKSMLCQFWKYLAIFVKLILPISSFSHIHAISFLLLAAQSFCCLSWSGSFLFVVRNMYTVFFRIEKILMQFFMVTIYLWRHYICAHM